MPSKASVGASSPEHASPQGTKGGLTSPSWPKGGLIDLSVASFNAQESNSKYSFTKTPSGWPASPCFKRAPRFQPDVPAQDSRTHEDHSVPFFSGNAGLKKNRYPAPGSYDPFLSSSVELGASLLEDYSGRLGAPSKTRPSFFSRRVRNTEPQGDPAESGPACLSLHGQDRLLEPPTPDCGSYEQPESQFAWATKDKGRATASYRSKTARFAPTRDVADSAGRDTGLPEAGRRPLVKSRGERVRWRADCKVSEGLRKGGELRLGKARRGFARGTTALPASGTYYLSVYVKNPTVITADSWSRHDAEDTVTLRIGGKVVAAVKNEPGQMVPVMCTVTGASFDWEFEFLSSHTHYASHQIVMDGTVRCDTVHVEAHSSFRRLRDRQRKKAAERAPRVSAPSPSAHLAGSMREASRWTWGARSLRASGMDASALLDGDELEPEDERAAAGALETRLSVVSNVEGEGQDKAGASTLLSPNSKPGDDKIARARQRRQHDLDVQCVEELEKFVEPDNRTVRFY